MTVEIIKHGDRIPYGGTCPLCGCEVRCNRGDAVRFTHSKKVATVELVVVKCPECPSEIACLMLEGNKQVEDKAVTNHSTTVFSVRDQDYVDPEGVGQYRG